MKLYDVIRKEDLEQGTPLREIPADQPDPYEAPRPFSWKKIIIVGICVFVLFVLYIVGMKVVRAKVVVVERRIPFSLQDTSFDLVHEKEATNTVLSFQTMVVTAEVSREVYGSELSASTSKATGKVIFFNEYSKTAQTIKAKTTLTGKNGKKYQVQDKVIVPGYTLKGKVKVAGTSAPASIVALDVGPSYNTTGTSFTVAGWSSTMYAQSAGELSGGEDGMQHVVSEKDTPQVLATLQSQLTEKLKRETRAQIPPNLITFPDLQVVTFDTDALRLRGTGIKFPATIKGTMVSYLISRDLLEDAIADKALHDQTYTAVSIPDLGGIKVTPVNAIPLDPHFTPERLALSISGDGTLITKVSPEVIAGHVVGIRKKVFNTVMGTIPEIDTARFTLYPFWAPLFPSNESRIKIIIQ